MQAKKKSSKASPSAQGYVREDKTIAVQPLRVLGVEGHELVEQDVGYRGHAHRGTWVT